MIISLFRKPALFIAGISLVLTMSGRARANEEMQDREADHRVFELSFSNLIDGRQVSTVAKSRGSLIVFWSGDCVPCLREIPELNRLYGIWQRRDVEIIGIPLDERPERVIELCGRFAVLWPQYFESGRGVEKALATEWGIRYTPYFLLLDEGGQVLEHGFSDPAEAMDRHFIR